MVSEAAIKTAIKSGAANPPDVSERRRYESERFFLRVENGQVITWSTDRSSLIETRIPSPPGCEDCDTRAFDHVNEVLPSLFGGQGVPEGTIDSTSPDYESLMSRGEDPVRKYVTVPRLGLRKEVMGILKQFPKKSDRDEFSRFFFGVENERLHIFHPGIPQKHQQEKVPFSHITEISVPDFFPDSLSLDIVRLKRVFSAFRGDDVVISFMVDSETGKVSNRTHFQLNATHSIQKTEVQFAAIIQPQLD